MTEIELITITTAILQSGENSSRDEAAVEWAYEIFDLVRKIAEERRKN